MPADFPARESFCRCSVQRHAEHLFVSSVLLTEMASSVFTTNTSGHIRRIGHEGILSAIIHKLHVSGHMLVGAVFLVLVCGIRAQSFSASFK
jgi:hypothetical protein